MKQKVLLLSILLASTGFCAFASGTGSKDMGPGIGDDELNGHIMDAGTKKPLKDVSITVYNASKKEKKVLTNEAGYFELDDLSPGTYKLVFEKPGFKKITKDKIVVKTNEAFQMNIEMSVNGNFDLMPSPFHLMDY